MVSLFVQLFWQVSLKAWNNNHFFSSPICRTNTRWHTFLWRSPNFHNFYGQKPSGIISSGINPAPWTRVDFSKGKVDQVCRQYRYIAVFASFLYKTYKCRNMFAKGAPESCEILAKIVAILSLFTDFEKFMHSLLSLNESKHSVSFGSVSCLG